MALIPFTVFVDTEIGKQLAHIFSPLARHRHIMCRPRVRRDMVLSPAGIASGLRIHFQKDEISKAALVQSPGRAQARNASSNDHDWYSNLLSRNRELRMI